jgi:hypothetical protein
MKRVLNFKSIVAIAAMLLFASGSFAQILTDYQDVAETSYQTAGTSFRLYAYPDTVYSPTYNPATNANINANARWTWTFAGLTATAPVVTATAVAQNFVEFTNVTAGSYTITVAESNTIAGCVDGTAESQDVTVIAAPQATITTADPAQACGNQVAMNISMSFTEAVPAAIAGYAFEIQEVVENIDPSDAVIGAALSTNNTFVDFPMSAKLNTGTGLTGAASPYGYTFATSALNVQNNLRTRYTYTLLKATDAPGAAADGIISAISQKSDYLGGTIQTYAFTDNQIVIIVNPAPVTGPIYHIPNNFAY